MTLKQKFQNEIETESTASLNLGHVPSWGVLIFGEGHHPHSVTVGLRFQAGAWGHVPPSTAEVSFVRLFTNHTRQTGIQLCFPVLLPPTGRISNGRRAAVQTRHRR